MLKNFIIDSLLLTMMCGSLSILICTNWKECGSGISSECMHVCLKSIIYILTVFYITFYALLELEADWNKRKNEPNPFKSINYNDSYISVIIELAGRVFYEIFNAIYIVGFNVFAAVIVSAALANTTVFIIKFLLIFFWIVGILYELHRDSRINPRPVRN